MHEGHAGHRRGRPPPEPVITFWPAVKPESAERARARTEFRSSLLKGSRAIELERMFMIVFSALTALPVSALASCVARSASVEATVASATLAVPAAAWSDTFVALLVTPFSESIA